MDIILSEKVIDTLRSALRTFGIKNQEDIAIEEMSELTKAIIKNRRYNTEETKAGILEEIADVQIMLLQLMLHYGYPKIIFTEKINRLKRRIENWYMRRL